MLANDPSPYAGKSKQTITRACSKQELIKSYKVQHRTALEAARYCRSRIAEGDRSNICSTTRHAKLLNSAASLRRAIVAASN